MHACGRFARALRDVGHTGAGRAAAENIPALSSCARGHLAVGCGPRLIRASGRDCVSLSMAIIAGIAPACAGTDRPSPTLANAAPASNGDGERRACVPSAERPEEKPDVRRRADRGVQARAAGRWRRADRDASRRRDHAGRDCPARTGRCRVSVHGCCTRAGAFRAARLASGCCGSTRMATAQGMRRERRSRRAGRCRSEAPREAARRSRADAAV